MGLLGRLFFFCVVSSILAMEDSEKPLVLVGTNAVIEQGVWARTKIIAGRVGWLKLPVAAYQAFGVTDMFDEPSGRKKFFEFLRKLPLEEKLAQKEYAHVFYKDTPLPPLLAARASGRLTFEEAQTLADAFIKRQEVSDTLQKFYGAVLITTLDPKIMAETCFVNQKTMRLINKLYEHGIRPRLVGHCDGDSFRLLQQKYAKDMAKFSTVLLSSDIPDASTEEPLGISAHTTFDAKFWLAWLAQFFPETKLAPSYIFIDDGTGREYLSADELPHHYTCGSSKEMDNLELVLGWKK